MFFSRVITFPTVYRVLFSLKDLNLQSDLVDRHNVMINMI